MSMTFIVAGSAPHHVRRWGAIKHDNVTAASITKNFYRLDLVCRRNYERWLQLRITDHIDSTTS